jgi:hypothetical protein
MISIGKILKRAWHILWNYRILWVFGFLLAIFGGSRGGGGNGGGGSGYKFNGNNGSQTFTPSTNPQVYEAQQWFQHNIVPLFTHPAQHIATFVWIGVGLFLLILAFAVIFALVRYPAETAVIRMVDEYEQTGTKQSFKQGWKMGWNRRAFRLWVIDLVISLPVFIFLAVLAGLGWLVYLGVRSGAEAAIASSVIAAVGCAFLFIFAFIILMVLLGLLRQFFVRAAALENTGIAESFRYGWAMFKGNWKSAALMWLVMLGIGIASGIVMLIVFFLLIPAYLVLILPAAIVAAIPGLIAFGVTSIFSAGPLAWILGIIVAVPFFFMIMFAPLAVVNGWYLVYESSVWTLTYREIKALEGVAKIEAPAKVE